MAKRAGTPELVIIDTRPNAVHRRMDMNGVQRVVYEICDHRRHFQGIVRSVCERRLGSRLRGLAACLSPAHGRVEIDV
jgi:hypothetical protein